MKTTKMNLADMQGKLSRTEMKNIMAGSGSGEPCLSEYRYDCSVNPENTQDRCCAGLHCVMNGTGTGTICML